MARIAGVDLPRTKRGRDRADPHLWHRPEALERHPDRGGCVRYPRKDPFEEDVRKISRVIEEQGRVEGDRARRSR